MLKRSVSVPGFAPVFAPSLALGLALLLALLPALCLSQVSAYPVSKRTISAAGAQAFPIALWYPAVPGRYPLVLFSHGSGGSERSLRDWAEHLARSGYVVAAPRHWGDSYDRPAGRGSDVQLIGRALQAQAALDSVLADRALAGSIDPQRIGMLGFSAGGYTTLVMAGARPDFARWHAHCKAHASEDDEFCPTLVWRSLPRITRHDWRLPIETRLKAAVLMAPAAILFDKAALSGVRIPVRIYAARDDMHVQNRWNASTVAAWLSTPVAVNLVPGGHYVFLTPCTRELLAEAPALCVDAPGVERAAIHRRIAEELVTFFNATLYTPSSAPRMQKARCFHRAYYLNKR